MQPALFHHVRKCDEETYRPVVQTESITEIDGQGSGNRFNRKSRGIRRVNHGSWCISTVESKD